MRRFMWLSLPVVAAVAAVALLVPAYHRRTEDAHRSERPRHEKTKARAKGASSKRPSPAPRQAGPTTRWIAAGGGPTPELNPISLEQDLSLATEVLGDEGMVLFASGRDAQVQILDPEPRGDALDLELGALFSPRQGRDSHYRRARLAVDGPATVEATLDALGRALAATGPPLLLYLAGHGEMGESPKLNDVPLWGDEPLGVEDLARVLDDAGLGARRTRVVITACHSGGFAEIAFVAADEGRGPARTDRCGLFATTWDLGASGCDPDPDRRRQEGYGIHFLHALESRDRAGAQLGPASGLDLDGDGRVGLLEAHTRARIASASLDVPTTTSERWLRAVAPKAGPSPPVDLREEDAVIAALAPALDLAGAGLETARARLEELEEELSSLGEQATEARSREQAAARRLAAELLARWPVIDDPWHPDYAPMRADAGPAIRAFLDESASRAELDAAREATSRLDARIAPLEVVAARVERVVRALETRTLAGRLRARGGADWAMYERFLECERSLP